MTDDDESVNSFPAKVWDAIVASGALDQPGALNEPSGQGLPRLAYRYREVAEMCGVHRDTVKAWVRKGHIRAVHIGTTGLIPAAELKRLFDREEQQ